MLQFPAELLASCSPVVGNVLTEVLHVTLEVQLILFKPADIEFLARGTTLELPSDVLFIITDDPMGRKSVAGSAVIVE